MAQAAVGDVVPSDSSLQLETLSAPPVLKEFEPQLFIVEATREFVTGGGQTALLDAVGSGTKKRFSLITPEILLNYAVTFVPHEPVPATQVAPTVGEDGSESQPVATTVPFNVAPAVTPPQLPSELLALHTRLQEQQQAPPGTASGTAPGTAQPAAGEEAAAGPAETLSSALAAAVAAGPPELWAKLLAAKIDADRVVWAINRHATLEEEQRMDAMLRQNARKKKPAPAPKKPDGAAPQEAAPAAADAAAGLAQGAQAAQLGAAALQRATTANAPVGTSSVPQTAPKPGAKKRKAGDAFDDAPQDGPDMYYLLSGFPAAAAQIPAMAECAVPLSAVVTVAVSPEIKKAAAELAAGGRARGKPGVGANVKGAARKPPPKARGPTAAAEPGDRPGTDSGSRPPADAAQAAAEKAAAEIAAGSFSQLCADIRALNDTHLLWLEVREGDPADGVVTLQRVASKLYEISNLRRRYLEWLRTCNVVSLQTPTAQTASPPPDDPQQRYGRYSARVPEQAAGALVVLDGVVEQATGSPGGAADDVSCEEEAEAALALFLDRSLQHLLGERPSASQSSSEAAPPEPILLNHADVIGKSVVGAQPKVAKRLRAIEQQHLAARKIPGKGRAGMPPTPELDALERETEREELADFMRGRLPGALTASELDRLLTLLSFEDMMAETDPSGQWPFDDRVYIERISPELFPRVFADAAVARPVQYSRYDPESDSVLICLDTGASDSREKRSFWQSGISAKTGFKQWLDAQAPGALAQPPAPLAAAAPADGAPGPSAAPAVAAPPATAAAAAPEGQAALNAAAAEAQRGSVIYDIDELRAKILRRTTELYPVDGCVIRASTIVAASHSSTNVTIEFPEGEVVAVSTTQPENKKPRAPPAQSVVTASGQFCDGSRFAVRCDPAVPASTTLSYTQTSGLVVSLNLDGRVDLVPPRPDRPPCSGSALSEDCWQPGVLFAPAHPPGDLHGDVEVSRSVIPDSSGAVAVARYFAGGAVTVLRSSGAVESYDPRTRTNRVVTDHGQQITELAHERPHDVAFPVGVARVTDPETRQVVTTRADMTMTVRSATGESYTRFADGTLLRNAADGTTQVCSPGSVDVRVSRGAAELEVRFGDGAVARIVRASAAAAAALHLAKPGAFAVMADAQTASLQPARVEAGAAQHLVPIDVGVYRVDLQSGAVATPDYERRSHRIAADGTVAAAGDYGAGDELPLSLTHPPRLFRVYENGAACEYLPQALTERFLARAKAAKGAYVIEQAAEGSAAAANIACWTRHDLPRAYGDDAEDGLAPRIVAVADPCALEAAVRPQAEGGAPVVAVVRELVRHRRLPDDEMQRVLDALDDFDRRQQRAEPTAAADDAAALSANDPRTPQEREAQRALLARLEDMLRTEAATAASIAASAALTPDAPVELLGPVRTARPTSRRTTARGSSVGGGALSRPVSEAPGGGAPSSAAASGAAASMSALATAIAIPAPPQTAGDDTASAAGRAAASASAAARRTTEALQQLQQQPLNYFNTEEAVSFLRTQPLAQRAASAKRHRRYLAARAAPDAAPPAEAPKPTARAPLVVSPATLPFGAVLQAPSAAHTLSVSVANTSAAAQRFSVTAPKDAAVWRVTYPHGPVAPGITARVVVELRPGAAPLGKLSEELLVNFGAGDSVRVALQAHVMTLDEATKSLPAERVQQLQRRAKAVPPSQASTLPPL